MGTLGQSKISSFYICVWCEAGELGGRRRSRFPCVASEVETFDSDRVAFRIPSNINDGAPQRKQPATLTRRPFLQKAPSQTSDWIPNVDLTGSAVNVVCGWTASAWNS